MDIFQTLIVQPIFNLLVVIYSSIPGGDFGIALIIFTILVRILLYPLVKKQLHQTKMMKKLQPKLAEIKKQAGGNRQVEAMRMMELYKQHGVSPMRSIGILLIQLPIFIGLFNVIQIFTNHRDQVAKYTYDFLENIAPIQALIQNPEHFTTKMLGFIDLTGVALGKNGIDIVLVILAVISGITQYIMTKQTMPTNGPKRRLKDILNEAAEGKQHDQSEMNEVIMSKMVLIMPLLMTVVMLSVAGALSLYYTVSNFIAIVQQSYILKQDETELEELADTAVVAPPKHSAKHTAAEHRERRAKRANITRIKASDTKRKKG